MALIGIAGPGSFAERSGALFVALAGAVIGGALPLRQGRIKDQAIVTRAVCVRPQESG